MMSFNQKQKCNLKSICREFEKSCKGFIARLNEGEKSMAMGVAAQEMNQSFSENSQPSEISIPNTQSEELRILTHAFIIQEWNLLLDSVFEKVISFCIQQKKDSELAFKMKIDLDLSQIDFDTSAKVRNSIVEQLKESFSFDSYNEKEDRIKKFFFDLENVKDELGVIKKNVIIRNIFQHHRGKVREKDIKDVGRDLIILDDTNEDVKYKVGDQLSIGRGEIDKLFSDMIQVTKEIEVYR